MTMRRTLQIIFAISLVGVIFSGTLTYREFTAQITGCAPVGQPGTILGYPPCVYGLVMYALVGFIAAWGLASRR